MKSQPHPVSLLPGKVPGTKLRRTSGNHGASRLKSPCWSSTSVKSTLLSLGCALVFSTLLLGQNDEPKRPVAPSLKKGEKQLFVDSVMIREKLGVTRVVHPAKKLEHPVLSAEMPWEWKEQNGAADKRLNIYGTVLRDEKNGAFQMWYAENCWRVHRRRTQVSTVVTRDHGITCAYQINVMTEVDVG